MATPKIFLYTHKKLSNGSYPIVLQIIKDRKRKLISLGHSATLAQWDIENNQPTKKHPNQKDLVLLIQKKLYQANKAIMELDEADTPYTIEDIISKLKSNKSSSSVFRYTGKIGHIDHPRSFWRDHAFPAAKDHPKLTSFFASFLS
jgi:integrase/recombinase XerD